MLSDVEFSRMNDKLNSLKENFILFMSEHLNDDNDMWKDEIGKINYNE